MSRLLKIIKGIDPADAVVLMLSAAALIVFLPVKDFGFVSFDDAIHITNNPYVLSGLTVQGIKWAFTTTLDGNWIPLMWLSHMVDVALYGARPGGHHISNLILHTINTILLFLLLKEMTGDVWRGAFIAALFALHPAHVEAVAWVSQRKELLSALFGFAAMFAYVKYTERPSLKRYMYVICLFIPGLMSKPMLVTLPFVLLLLDNWPLGRLRQTGVAKLIIEKIPMFAISGVFSVITYFAQKNYKAVISLTELPLPLRVANVLVSYVKYLKNALMPTELSVFYPRMELVEAWQWIGALIILSALSVCVVMTVKRSPYYFTGWFWFLGALVPVIGIVQVGAQGMADRYTYIPFIGLFIAAAYALPSKMAERPSLRILSLAAVMAIILSSVTLSVKQVGYWQNSTVLLKHAAGTIKTSALLYYNLGTVLAEEGKYEQSLDAFDRSIEIEPTRADVFINKGAVYMRIHQFDKAAESYSKAIAIRPDIPEAYNGLGEAMMNSGKRQTAVALFQKALSINPKYARAQSNLAMASY
ncbi:tetratricopeptide repeat protein [Candidatus Magnetominusculus dajiuhuensis]|uniref:tetratricopeptide repeat protein n=1 Tax=Candidatus Magnetominusculus dajiuhuensis TaxID=3137712 RepID=UPI003B432FE6